MLDRSGDPGLLVQDLSDQHGPEQMRNDGRQRPAQMVIHEPAALHQAEIGKAVGGSVQQNTGGVLQSLGARPLLVKLALAELLDRQPVLRAMDLADIEKPDRVRRIKLAVMLEIGLQEVRFAADVAGHVNCVGCAPCHQAGALRAGVFDDACERVVPKRLVERRVVDILNNGKQLTVRGHWCISQESKPFW